MGGYIALEIVRQAADRVAKLALLDTGSRADTPEATAKRHANIALAEAGRFDEVIDPQFPIYVHPSRADDAALKADYLAMCHDVGPQAFVRQQKAIMTRVDSRPLLPTIRCPTLVLVGEQDAGDAAGAVRRDGGRDPRRAAGEGPGVRPSLDDGAAGGRDRANWSPG